jgi:hypothetical protein
MFIILPTQMHLSENFPNLEALHNSWFFNCGNLLATGQIPGADNLSDDRDLLSISQLPSHL